MQLLWQILFSHSYRCQVVLFQIAAVIIATAQDHHHQFGCYLRSLLPGMTCVFWFPLMSYHHQCDTGLGSDKRFPHINI